MSLTTRTHWIDASDLQATDDIAGFGPLASVRGIVGKRTLAVSNIHGCSRMIPAYGSVQLYDGVYNEAGRRISMSPEAYRASVLAEQA
jgi:hypothetical protein